MSPSSLKATCLITVATLAVSVGVMRSVSAAGNGATGEQDAAPVDPMRTLIGRQPTNPFDPMRQIPKLDEYVEYDPMPHYARRATVAIDPSSDGHVGYDPMASLRGLDAPAVPTDQPTLGGLPAGPAQGMTLGLCGMCHSIRLVTQQRLPAYRWDELWDWMIEKQGMPNVGPVVKKQVTDYLKKHFSAPSPEAAPKP